MGPSPGYWWAEVDGSLAVVLVEDGHAGLVVWYFGKEWEDTLEFFEESGYRLVRRIEEPIL